MENIEFIAAILGVVSVWYSRKNNILVYPTGIISVILYVYICYSYHLFADAILNAYYFVMSIIGWNNWSKKEKFALVYPISFCTKVDFLKGFLLFIIIQCTLYFGLIKFTSSTVPLLDSLVSSLSALAMWWMATRKIENWIAWILANLLALPLFYMKELYFTVGQYAIFLFLAIWGLFTWLKIHKSLKFHV